jgi:hypothetical protein
MFMTSVCELSVSRDCDMTPREATHLYQIDMKHVHDYYLLYVAWLPFQPFEAQGR